ncbi:MAG: Spy/CpxP family protein refolding chaperone [Acidobacteriota bacterium]|nr:Spy/CpxP family protein refolding chaperone [Acidobacteriota bacterium]
MKTQKIILMSSLFAIVLTAAGFQPNVGAQQRPGRPDGPPPAGQRGPGEDRIFERLNLTAEQKQKIETLRDQQHEAAEPYHNQLRDLREQMSAIVEASTFNEAAARAVIAKEVQIEAELKLIRVRTDNAIHNVLTAEQKAKLEDLRRNRREPRYGN